MAETTINDHSLNRWISDPKKREIRQKCGFGCVICGCALYEYAHIDPPFREAKEHDPEKIVLLCPNCHTRLDKGVWSIDKVRRAMVNPKCRQKGYSFDIFDIGDNSPVIVLGTITWTDTPVIIEALGNPLLMIEPPEESGGPYRLSGVFYNEVGQEIFRIVQNEWQGSTANWDIEFVGKTITIRRAKGRIALKIRTDPPNKLLVERLDMFYKGFQIIGVEGKITRVINKQGSTIYAHPPSTTRSILETLDIPFLEKARQKVLSEMRSEGVTFVGCEAGVILEDNGTVGLGRGCRKTPDMGGGSILITK